MLDFTEGTTWFFSGLGVTAFFIVLIVVFAWFARRQSSGDLEADPALGVFDRIVCGVDNSPEALEAARQAERLRPPDGLIRLTAVTEINVAVQTGLAMSHAAEELDAQLGRGSGRPKAPSVRPGHTSLFR